VPGTKDQPKTLIGKHQEANSTYKRMPCCRGGVQGGGQLWEMNVRNPCQGDEEKQNETVYEGNKGRETLNREGTIGISGKNRKKRNGKTLRASGKRERR